MKKFFQLTKSLEETGVKTYEELWKKAVEDGFNGLAIQMETKFTKSAVDDNVFHAIFSTASEDRHGEIVYQDWDLKSFKKNPVYLDSHNYDSIEHIIGKVIAISSDKSLEGDVVFALSNPKGQLAYDLAREGFLNTSSVGFIPKQFDDKGNILKSELLEISAVSVPANAEALYEKKDAGEIISTPEEIIAPIIPTEDELVIEVIPAVEPACDKKAIAARTISSMVKEQKKILKSIAKDVNELVEDNKQSKKRSIYKSIRKLLSNQ